MIVPRPLTELKSFGKIAKQGVALSFLREGVAEILFFPASMVLARLLTPREFGIATAALFFVLLASRLSELGFNAALVRSKVITPLHMSTVFVVNMSTGVAMFLTLVVAAPLIGRFYGVPETGSILPIAALGFLISPLGSVPASALAREMRFKEKTIIDWCQGMTFAGAAVIFAWQGFSFWSLVYARLAGSVVQTAGAFYFSRWRPSLRFSSAALREILSFAAGMHARRMLEYSAQNLDNLVIGKVMGMTALGLYDKAFSTMWRVLGRLNSGGPGVMFRIFALIHEDPDRFRRAYGKVVMSASLIGVPIFAVLAATAPQIMLALFGSQWTAAAAPFQVLCVVGILKLLNSYASTAIQAAGQVWSEVWRQIAYIALIVGLVVAFRNYGPLGGAIGVMLATLCMTVLMHVLLRRVTHLTWRELLRPLVPALLCAAGATVAVLLVELALQMAPFRSTWLLLGCQAVAATIFYLAFILLAPHRELRALVRELMGDLAPAFVKRLPWVRAYLSAASGAADSATIG